MARPGFTVFAVLTLAIGIGANTAMFTVIQAVFLKSLPVPNPQSLLFVSDPDAHGFWYGENNGGRRMFTYREYELLRDSAVLEGTAAASSQPFPFESAWVGEGSGSRGGQLRVSLVSGNYFSVLGMAPTIGRFFDERAEEPRGAHPVVVLSHAYWEEKLGRDPGVLGRVLRLGKSTFQVVAVAGPGFDGETVGLRIDGWVPASMQTTLLPGQDWLAEEANPLGKAMWLQVFGRVRPGMTRETVKAQLAVRFKQYITAESARLAASDRKEFLNQQIELHDGSHGGSTLRKGYQQPLTLLMALVAALLVIACANVGNLLLARATARQKEMAIRIAIGANPARIFLQLLTESLLLALVGGAAAVWVAHAGALLLVHLVDANVVIHLNPGLLAFTLAVALVSGLLFGVVPALQAARSDQNAVLKGANSGSVSRRRFSASKLLVMAQVALSLLLVALAGLFVRSFQKLAAADVGFDREHVLLFDLSPVDSGYKTDEVKPLVQRVADRIRALPGVRSVSYSESGLFTGNDSNDPIEISGFVPTEGQEMAANFDHVGPNYFSTVGIPVLLGREIGPADEGRTQRVGVINQTMAKYYFRDASPIGKWMRDSDNLTKDGGFVIVGVVADAKYNSLREKTPRRFYVPWNHPIYPQQHCYVEVRAAGDPAGVMKSIRDAVRETAPTLPPIWITSVKAMTERTMGMDRLLTQLSGFFGTLAALLACLGIYAVMSYAVSRRSREIGIRMALGAQRGAVLRLILGECLLLSGLGIAIGIPAALAAGRGISALLFGLSPADPLALAGAALLMLLVAACAGLFPARRATRVDPMVALHAD